MATQKGIAILQVSTSKDEFVKPVGGLVFATGKFTTAGGDATETISVTGVLTTDVVIVAVNTLGTGSRTIVSAIAAANAITVTLSGDPSTDHVLGYTVIRAV